MSYYAQINYEQKLGDSRLTLREAGCFVTADSNLLEKVGVHVDPPTLNDFYKARKLFTYDLTDRANDNITWSTVTKYCPQLVVKQLGYSGWPDSDLAQVEFCYKSRFGVTVTHFCTVNRAADRSIIDSYDGKVKTPAQYEKYYGQPIAWATFVYHTPQTTPTAIVIAPLAAPAAVAPTPQPIPQTPKKIYLPPSVWIWHTYKPEGPYTLPYALPGSLNPKMFGGLTYDILGNPAPHIYIIQTQMFGRVAIYAGPDTVAQFPGIGRGEGEDTSVPVTEVVPAPVSEPATPAEPTVGSISYFKLENAIACVTKLGAQSYNFERSMIIQNFHQGEDFLAVGKAVLSTGDTYFMDESSFHSDDETKREPVGIITTSLLPALQKAVTYKTEPAAAPVTSTQPSSALPWQDTFEPIVKGDSKQHPTAVDYTVINDIEVYNLATGTDARIVKKGTPVPVVGTFWFAGHKYYLARSSFEKGTWYGFPVSHPAPSLVKITASNTPFDTNDDINQIEHDYEDYISRSKHAALKTGGSAEGILSRFKKHRSI